MVCSTKMAAGLQLLDEVHPPLHAVEAPVGNVNLASKLATSVLKSTLEQFVVFTVGLTSRIASLLVSAKDSGSNTNMWRTVTKW